MSPVPFDDTILLAALVSALLAVMVLLSARRGDAGPALRWWAAALAAETARLAAAAAFAFPDPASMLSVGKAGHAVVALLVLAGTCVFAGRERLARPLAIAAGAAAAAILGGALYPAQAAAAGIALSAAAMLAWAASAWLFWRRYRAERWPGYLAVLAPMAGMSLCMATDLEEALRFGMPGLDWAASGWAVFAHLGLTLLTIMSLVLVIQERAYRRQAAADQRAEATEQRLRDIAELAVDWIWETGPDLRFTYYSERFEEVTGLDRSQFLGRTRGELMDGGTDDPAWRAHLAHLEARRDPFWNFEYTLHAADGRPRHMRTSGRPVFDAKGGFLGYRGTGTDITAEIEARAQAELMDRRLKDAIESLPHSVALFDSLDRLVFCNSKYGIDYPWLADLMVPGTRYEDFLRASAARGTFAAAGGDLEAAIQARLAAHRDPPGHPLIVHIKGGRWVQISETKTAEGGTATSWTNITPLKRRERALALLVQGDATARPVLEVAAEALAEGLNCRWAGVAEYMGDGVGRVLAMWDSGGPGQSFEYDLKGTPCQGIYQAEDYCFYPDRVTELFPKDEILIEMKAVSYRGQMIRDAAGRIYGHVFALDDKPMDDETWREDLIVLIARWTGMALAQQQAEQALRENEQRARDFAESASDWRWEMDENLRFSYFSHGLEEKAGIQPERLLGKTREELLAAGDPIINNKIEAADWNAHLADLKARRPFRDFVHPRQRADGGLTYLSINGKPVFDAEGRFKGYRGSASNVTEQRRAVAALGEREQRIRAIMDSVGDGIVSIDGFGIIESVNRSVEKMFGYTPAELVGRNVSVLMAEPYRSQHDSFLRRYRETGQARVLGLGGREVLGQTRDGLPLAIELMIDRIRHGGQDRFIGILRDITERKRTEEAVRRKTAFIELSKAVAAAANEAASIEHALRVSIAAVCRVTGWAVGHAYLVADDGSNELRPTGLWHHEGEEEYRALRALVATKNFTAFQDMPGRVLASGEPEDLTRSSIEAPDSDAGKVFEHGVESVFGFPITVGAEVVGVLQFFSETSGGLDSDTREVMTLVGTQLGRLVERAKAERSLRAAKEAAEYANRAKGEFLATMSHELRTPLNAIIGFSEIMAMGVFGPLGHANYRDYAQDIQSSGTHLLNIINDILDVSKAEAGLIVLAEDDLDLAEAIESALRLIRPHAEEKRLTLETELPRAPVSLRADGRRLRQVLLNMLSNAVKFTEKGGIAIEAHADPEAGLSIRIVDTGVGIAEADLERVFDPFVQADATLTRSHEGTGLGLALSRKLVELHGGSLTLESRFGSGTVVTIHLPAERLRPSAKGPMVRFGSR